MVKCIKGPKNVSTIDRFNCTCTVKVVYGGISRDWISLQDFQHIGLHRIIFLNEPLVQKLWIFQHRQVWLYIIDDAPKRKIRSMSVVHLLTNCLLFTEGAHWYFFLCPLLVQLKSNYGRHDGYVVECVNTQFAIFFWPRSNRLFSPFVLQMGGCTRCVAKDTVTHSFHPKSYLSKMIKLSSLPLTRSRKIP